MKRFISALLTVIAVLIMACAIPVQAAEGHGAGLGGGERVGGIERGGGHGAGERVGGIERGWGHDGGWRRDGGWMDRDDWGWNFGWGWGPDWDFGWGGYPYYPYYDQAPVIIQQQPEEMYIQPEEPSYWYFCTNPKGYYPYVNHCPSGWMKVVPTPPPPAPPKK